MREVTFRKFQRTDKAENLQGDPPDGEGTQDAGVERKTEKPYRSQEQRGCGEGPALLCVGEFGKFFGCHFSVPRPSIRACGEWRFRGQQRLLRLLGSARY